MSLPAALRTVTSNAATYPAGLPCVHAAPTAVTGGFEVLVESGLTKWIAHTPPCPAPTGIACAR